MEDSNYVPIISVLINSQRFQPFKERFCTIWTIEELRVVFFVTLSAEQDGSLHSLVVHGSFIITIDLKGWVSLYPHSGIWIFSIGLYEVTRPYFVPRHPFQFGIILLFWNALDVTLMGGDMHLLFRNGAFAPTASVLFRPTSRFTSILHFVRLATLKTFFVGEANGWNIFTATMKMVRVTVLTKEGSMTQTTKRRR